MIVTLGNQEVMTQSGCFMAIMTKLFVRIMFRSLSFPYPEKYNFYDPQFVVTRHTGTLPTANKNLMN